MLVRARWIVSRAPCCPISSSLLCLSRAIPLPWTPAPKLSSSNLSAILPSALGIGRLRKIASMGGGEAGGITRTADVMEKVELSELEHTIFAKMLDAVRHFNLTTQLRVAGGWVRDKLLGKESFDIDIALDNMLGRDFCEKLNSYFQTIGEETQHVAVIMSNPEQSKHLETARMRVSGIWIDFVNLRAETYANHSRIPQMEFGTAEQDAYRRDLTINSLFYNINTGLVEDFTRRGILDLKNGIISTPMPPKCTFLEDPLRVLRAIRFGARFDFFLSEELKIAAASKEVISALSSKVSPERIGHEIELMLAGPRPVEAMRLLVELELFSTVFKPPSNSTKNIPDNWPRLCLSCLQMVVDTVNLFGSSKLLAEQKKVCFLAALFWPLQDVVVEKKNKQIPISSTIIRESLKLKVSDGNAVLGLHDASKGFTKIIEQFFKQHHEVSIKKREFDLDISLQSSIEVDMRVHVGLLLMKIKELWRAALVLSSTLQIHMDYACTVDNSRSPEEAAKSCIEFERIILKLGLENVWELKPLLDGRMIMNVLGLEKGCPLVNEWKERSIEWQLAHPTATQEECLSWFQVEHSKRIRTC